MQWRWGLIYAYNRKAHRLGPEDLTLPWKPLYEAIDRFIFGEFEARIYHSEYDHCSIHTRTFLSFAIY